MNQMWHLQAACGFGHACDPPSVRGDKEITDARFNC